MEFLRFRNIRMLKGWELAIKTKELYYVWALKIIAI